MIGSQREKIKVDKNDLIKVKWEDRGLTVKRKWAVGFVSFDHKEFIELYTGSYYQYPLLIKKEMIIDITQYQAEKTALRLNS